MSKYDGLTRASTMEDRRAVYQDKLDRLMDNIEENSSTFSGAMINSNMSYMVKYGRILERDERYDRNFNTLLCMAIRSGRLSFFYSPFSASSNFSKKYHPKELPFGIYSSFNSYLIDLPSIRIKDSFDHYESVIANIACFVRLLQMYDLMESFDMTPALMIMEAIIRDADDPFIVIPWFAITQNNLPEVDVKIMEVVVNYLDFSPLIDGENINKFVNDGNYNETHRTFRNKHNINARILDSMPAECQLGVLI